MNMPSGRVARHSPASSSKPLPKRLPTRTKETLPETKRDSMYFLRSSFSSFSACAEYPHFGTASIMAGKAVRRQRFMRAFFSSLSEFLR